MTETLIFVFVILVSDAPPVLTGLVTRQQCETMRSSIEPEILKLGARAMITPCIPVLIKKAPEA